MAESDLAWETRDRDVAYSCPGFDVVHEDVVLPDGTETDFDYLHEEPAVVVLPFTPDGEVVVIEEWRQAVDRVNRGLPAGGSEEDDADLDATARRELTEETGYVADDVEFLGAYEPANGIADTVHHYYVATGCTPNGEQDLDFDESIRVDTTDLATLRSAALSGGKSDARTALAVLRYEAERERKR
ncbi:NUDIX hydrolase [Halanaeroarchaeum sulfurireducens]|uniref:ADP-ribose pyrophosphatase, Mut/nudix family protein n=1 Tax=Halanaeroarchaeum sulfurireducens TaxID=1604004 RepID=A0A0F7PB92_9EURY|nr:NUDIX hydrolase [Halanaeroarchaeum sulfurireducens]AKH98431.1 ADP-ribose pyrophosphatase, Mut/nudix family protein [Halanaeroarchaeum sulfurireducens]